MDLATETPYLRRLVCLSRSPIDSGSLSREETRDAHHNLNCTKGHHERNKHDRDSRTDALHWPVIARPPERNSPAGEFTRYVSPPAAS
jgi:hypothetical protein